MWPACIFFCLSTVFSYLCQISPLLLQLIEIILCTTNTILKLPLVLIVMRFDVFSAVKIQVRVF